MKRREALLLREGDIVEMDDLPTHDGPHPLRAAVREVLDRPGTNPLVRYTPLNETPESNKKRELCGHPNGCDSSFISRVVQRYPFEARVLRPTRRNIYDGQDWASIERRNGVLVGFSLLDIAAGVIQTMPNLDVPRELCANRFRELYERDQRPGYVWSEVREGQWWHTAAVRRKPFRAWVLRNYRHFVTTRADLVVAHQEEEQAREDSYADDCARGLWDDGPFNEDDDPVGADDRYENLGLGDVLA